MQQPPERRRWRALAQPVLGVGLVSLLVFNMDNRADVLDSLLSISRHWGFGIAAIACFLVCLVSATLRWRCILKAHGMAISIPGALELTFIGQFFNAFMFGAVGGDAIKVFLVASAFPKSRTEAVTTVFIDRMIGMLALFGIAAAVLLARFRFFLRYPQTRSVAMVLMVVLAAVSALLFLTFRRNLLEQFAVFRKLESQTRLGAILSRTYRAFHACLTHPGLLARTILLSLVNHLALIAAAALLGAGLEIRTVPPTDPPRSAAVQATVEFGTYLTVFPIINGIASIPATPGGLGTRDAAAQFLLGIPEFKVPASRAVTLSLLLYAVTLFWSLVGGVIYATRATRSRC